MDQSIRLRRPDEKLEASSSVRVNFVFATGTKDAIRPDLQDRRFAVVSVDAKPADVDLLNRVKFEVGHGNR
jgi:hypothetical protein